jgi:hypothetical protein
VAHEHSIRRAHAYASAIRVGTAELPSCQRIGISAAFAHPTYMR